MVQSVQNTVFGRTIRQGVCPDCGGSGKIITDKCVDCKGKGYTRKETEITFNIPAGVDNGSYIRKRGGGNAVQGGALGDLIVVFKVEPHKMFVRENFDLKIEVPVSFKTAALGGTIYVPTLDGPVKVKVPAGTHNGKKLKLSGKGLNSKGSLYVTLTIDVPRTLTKEQKDLFTQLAQIS